MDISYQPPGVIVQNYIPYGGVAGSPSPPLSLCSEPILQFPMPDGRCGTPGLQLKTPRIQRLNKTMDEACKKKNAFRKTSRVEPPDMMNFFQPGLPFPDFYSDSGDGSLKGGLECLPSRYKSRPFAQLKTNPFQYQKLEVSQYPKCELHMPIPCVQVEGYYNQQIHQQPALANFRQASPPTWANLPDLNKFQYPSITKTKKQSQRGSDLQKSERAKTVSTENDSKFKRKSASAIKKKRLISTIKSSSTKKERTKHSVLQRKHRKQVQQKNKSLHKTELCTHWSLTSTCTYKGKCYFAHGIDELKKRARLSNYKTRPCVDCPPEGGRCLFGSRCNYCHPGEAIRRAVGSTYFDIDYYKAVRKEFNDNEYPFGIFI